MALKLTADRPDHHKSKCRACETVIREGDARVGVFWNPEANTKYESAAKKQFFHLACWVAMNADVLSNIDYKGV